MVVVLIVAAAIAAGVIIVGGGHTAQGFGHDMQNTGAKIEQSTDNQQ